MTVLETAAAGESMADPETLRAFEKEYGIDLNGRLPSEPGTKEYRMFMDFSRECFRRYVKHYTDEVHKDYPEFQITSNWLCSDYMPEPVPAGIDYLSGDFAPWRSVTSARTAARTLASQGASWDLMAWNFRVDRDGTTPGRFTKEPVQLMQEAACVTSLGGGFQDYIPQYRDGSPRMWQIRRLKPLEEMIRARQPYCFGARIVPQAAVLLSRHDRSAASAATRSWGWSLWYATWATTCLSCPNTPSQTPKSGA